MRILAYILALITLGGFVPPRVSSQPYRLVCSYFDEPRVTVYLIDADGKVARDQDLAVGNDPWQVTVSPDGRCFTVNEGSPGPDPPCFFVRKDGQIDQASTGPHVGNPAVFSRDGTVLFGGFAPCLSYAVDPTSRSVQFTGYSFPWLINDGIMARNMGYSEALGGPIWSGDNSDFVYGVPATSRGEFGDATEQFFFADKGSNRDMDASPDGRFVAILGVEDPQLAIIGIQPGGTFYSVENLLLPYSTIGNPYRVRYTPDGRFLLVLSTHYQHFLICFRVDPQSGGLTQTDFASSLAPTGGYVINALAITPDSRYAVFPNGIFTNGTQMTFMVYRINDDGTLTRITQERHDFPGYVSDMDFIPPYREPVTAASTGWLFYQ